ncbi:GNAT family N-acetyltransferase [Fluoribacter dumoffii]|uniref:Predicted acetyltransferase involved in intracellular survival and related acetyltransferases n=1 Tax=Fluoribacter dumoffii TaxID=463 RepID=A0A377G8C4_9GAMM|nr:GNAT family N-acetyltransferase [Fluoribacter dumoffii]KTC89934.1 putative Acetyltransferase, GNAT family [Fluoribacter dumoffii NY 23]MCW8418286.1 GNAT family N-acetyltransferase [Fluoribacter dumoffii]MCW8453872.1 GNAT family N-acetyltransferase [Fluoribacter dumoffii]MCW8462057.1 GNAT family N-acetyltransferase [Fluoribacter dumoffii]MCW8482269.1 GNAT family N-acetyltransferase [Fluoribacter dumoffii]
MKHVTKELAARMESCIKQTHIEVTRQYSEGKILEINGGAACFSGFDSYLSQVVGWGFATDPKNFLPEIERIEHFYKNLHHNRVDIELCPFVGNELTVFLSQRGYCISELNNVSILDLKSYHPVECSEEALTIRMIQAEERRKWAQIVALGFDAPEAEDQFFRYAQSKGVAAYAVYDNEAIIAGATIAMHGNFCDLGVTSTLPGYRGKGLQKKLLNARLNHAKQAGLSWATVTTEPGSISDCNVQKIGFHCAYTRIKMTRE